MFLPYSLSLLFSLDLHPVLFFMTAAVKSYANYIELEKKNLQKIDMAYILSENLGTSENMLSEIHKSLMHWLGNV